MSQEEKKAYNEMLTAFIAQEEIEVTFIESISGIEYKGFIEHDGTGSMDIVVLQNTGFKEEEKIYSKTNLSNEKEWQWKKRIWKDAEEIKVYSEDIFQEEIEDIWEYHSQIA